MSCNVCGLAHREWIFFHTGYFHKPCCNFVSRKKPFESIVWVSSLFVSWSFQQLSVSILIWSLYRNFKFDILTLFFWIFNICYYILWLSHVFTKILLMFSLSSFLCLRTATMMCKVKRTDKKHVQSPSWKWKTMFSNNNCFHL